MQKVLAKNFYLISVDCIKEKDDGEILTSKKFVRL